MHPLEQKIKDSKANGRIALIPFITAEFPNPENFWTIFDELDQTADIIEIGIPFSDPVADGPVVEEASRRVLEKGFNFQNFIAQLKNHSRKGQAALVLMGYYNPFLQYGLEEAAKDSAAAGVNGLIVPDLPYEESFPMRRALGKYNISLIPLVGPNTDKKRMALYAADAQGYVYVVSVMGTTGERKEIANNVASIIDQAREVFSVPIALGFGLKKPDQLESLPEKSRPDAAVFGSALIRHVDAGKSAREFMEMWQ